MVLRLNIDRIELATRDWICKIQIVEIGRPRKSLDKKCRFQIFILEDEEVSGLYFSLSVFFFFFLPHMNIFPSFYCWSVVTVNLSLLTLTFL
uniref:Uncharacterized protein n=1 Tax=Solanum tuberosum TaxID=4113 RepID=M1A8Q2_SOLTU